MRWSGIGRLYGRRLRARLGQELFAFAGVAVGVALLFAVQVSNASLAHSIADLTRGFVGRAQLQLVARSANGLDERIAGVVARDPSVEAAAPVLQLPINLVGPAGERGLTLLAADARVAQLGGTALGGLGLASVPRLNAVALPAEIARAVGAHAGGRVRLQIAGRSVRARVAATLNATAGGTLAAAPVVLAPLPYGQRLAHASGRVSRLYVRARPGREAQVRQLLHGLAGDRLDVRPADFDERVFAQAAQPNDESSSLFSQVTALVGFMFALNAMLLMARDRRRLIAKLRLDGHSARTIRRLLTLDALVLGVVASAAGLLLGQLLSERVLPPAPGYLTIGFPIGTARTVDAGAVVSALLAGIGAALVGTFAPLVQRLRRPVADDGLEAEEGRNPLRHRPRWLAAAAAALAGALIVWFLSPRTATAGIVLLLAACVLCLPTALALVLALATRLARNARTPVPALAIGELRANGTRSITLAAVAAIAVFASGAIEGARRDLQAGLDTVTHAVSAIADVWISPASANNQLGVYTFPTAARAAVARVPHVRGVGVYRGELLTIGTRLMWVFAPAPASRELVPANQLLDGDAGTVQARVRSGAYASVSRAFATEHHLRVGSRYTIPAPTPQRVRVAAITTNIGWPPGAIVVGRRTFDAGWGPGQASALQVQLDAATAPERGRDLIARALAATPWSGFTIETAAERERHQRRASRDGLVRLQQISRLVLLTAALAMAIAIGAMILERRRGLATLKLRGLRRAQLRLALLLETALLLATGCATGAVFALAGTQLLDRWLTTLTGFPVVRSSGALAAGVSLAAVVAIALAITTAPIARAANVSVEAAFDD
jgi:putative ABC transport system permease protein